MKPQATPTGADGPERAGSGSPRGGGDEAERSGGGDPAIARALAASPAFEAYSLTVKATTPDGREHALRVAGDSEGPQGPLGEWAWDVEVREPDEAVRVVQAKIVEGHLQVRLGSARSATPPPASAWSPA